MTLTLTPTLTLNHPVQVAGKLTSNAVRVPTPNVSLAILILSLEQEAPHPNPEPELMPNLR